MLVCSPKPPTLSLQHKVHRRPIRPAWSCCPPWVCPRPHSPGSFHLRCAGLACSWSTPSPSTSSGPCASSSLIQDTVSQISKWLASFRSQISTFSCVCMFNSARPEEYFPPEAIYVRGENLGLFCSGLSISARNCALTHSLLFSHAVSHVQLFVTP